SLKPDSRVATAHQPYFFNPGVAVKFIFLEKLSKGKKQIVFLDTDKTKISVAVPAINGLKAVEFINSECVLFDYPSLDLNNVNQFFVTVEEELGKMPFEGKQEALRNLSSFKGIFLKNCNKELLKEVLADSFLDFFGIEKNYIFLSQLLGTDEYRDFVMRIHKEAQLFRDVFNKALDSYRQNFRFRYKNFPFPKLIDRELPLWVVKDKVRQRCFTDNFDVKARIFPRAAALTIFLRLYKFDVFIHGVGGANYEWVCDRVIEDFFKARPPLYAVISATFLIDDFKERNLPYFLFSPVKVKETVGKFMRKI
ncbi:MAG: hypothetical protein JSV34_06525, partial [Candidatus Omnitrophota bacterium]